MAGVTEEAVLNALRGVVDPELGADIVDLGMVRSVEVDAGVVTVHVALTIAGCPLRDQIASDAKALVGALEGVREVKVETAAMEAGERSALMAKVRRRASESAAPTAVPETARVLAVASGKGGVGKSTVSVNLAVALARPGRVVGLLDADIWGFSVPRMLGVSGELRARDSDRRIVPLERRVGHGTVRVVSMGFLAQEDAAIMWRGLMLNKAVEQFLTDVDWDGIDYLVIDMPPGTGDVQMGLARTLPRAEVVIVTTPPLAAQKVAARAASMARKGYLRVAGVIENMSAFVCDHGTSYPLFGSGGGERLASEIGVPLIGSVPLDSALAASSDGGEPIVIDGSGPASRAFARIAERIVQEVAPPVEMSSCSARILRAVDAAKHAS
jgi:ATP-binding protein involved in chromosome partitioning